MDVLIANLGRIRKEKEADVFRAYRNLLLNVDGGKSLSPAETTRLAEVAHDLGKDEMSVQSDLAILAKERELAKKVKEGETLPHQSIAATEDCQRHAEKMEREIGALKAEANRLAEISSNLERRQLQLFTAPSELAKLRATNRRLLGITPERKLAHLLPMASVVKIFGGIETHVFEPLSRYKPRDGYEVVSVRSDLMDATIDLAGYRFVRCEGQTIEEFESLRQKIEMAYAESPDLAPEFA